MAFAAPMINPDKCNVIHHVTIPSKEHLIGFLLNRKCFYEDRCGGKTNNTQGNGFNRYWYFRIHDILVRPPIRYYLFNAVWYTVEDPTSRDFSDKRAIPC